MNSPHEFFAAALPEKTFHVHQVHGTEIFELGDAHISDVSQIQADGLIATHGERIAVQTADCIPALFSSGDGKIVAAVHAGWRGMLDGILIHAVERLRKLGANNLRVALGPSIRGCCFEVSEDVARRFQKKWGQLWQVGESPIARQTPTALSPKSYGDNLWIHLPRLAKLQLALAGVTKVQDSGICTYCDPKALNSHRRWTHAPIPKPQSAGRGWSWIQSPTG